MLIFQAYNLLFLMQLIHSSLVIIFFSLKFNFYKSFRYYVFILINSDTVHYSRGKTKNINWHNIACKKNPMPLYYFVQYSIKAFKLRKKHIFKISMKPF